MALVAAPLGAVPGIISTNGVPGFPQLKTGTGCPNGESCLGETFCTILGCACLGICIGGGGNGGVPFDPGFPPGNGGPAPPPPGPFPPAPPPPTAPPPQVPQIGGCPPRAGAIAAVACPAGCHPNKSDYFLKSGSFVPRGTRCVRNRRRNPLNPRALDRAISRIGSAQNAVARLGFQKKSPRRRKRAPASIC